MTRQYAYFQVTGSGTPDAITQAIGVAPTICNSDKDVNSKTGRPWDVMRWRLNSGELEHAPVQQHVDAILLWLNRRPSAVKSLGDAYELTLHIACWATDTFGLHLTRDQVRILGRLGIAIDYDGYIEKSQGEAES